MAAAGPLAHLTDEQRQAVVTTDVGVAVSAGAGCGKTSVLTARFLTHLERTELDVDVEEVHEGQTSDTAGLLRKLVAITFTDRAAREMRDRIRKDVRKRLTQASIEDEANHWLDVLRRLESAQISTIHSFCGTLLRRHAVEAGLDPRFTLMKPHEAGTIVAELIDDKLRELLAAADETLIRLITNYDLDGVRKVTTFLLHQRYRLQWSEWLAMTVEELVERWSSFHQEIVVPEIAKQLLDSYEYRAVLHLIRETLPPHEVHRLRCVEILDLDARLRKPKPKGLPSLLESLNDQAKIVGGPRTAWAGYEDLKERYKTAFEDLRGQIKKLKPMFEFDATAARPAAEAGLDFVRLAAPISAQYEEEKRQSSALDFDDLLLKTRDLLCLPQNRKLCERVARNIGRMLVDECQDTDPLQKELIESLVGSDESRQKLFLVGDFKQSIYRFRRADPQIFRDWRGMTAEHGRLPLSKNFRSQPEILRFVNALFADYFGDEYEPLRPHRKQRTPLPAIEFMWATPTDESESPRNVEALRKMEAEWIARRIKGWLDSQELLLPDHQNDGVMLPAKPGDIALLFRSLNDAAVYENALDEQGIKYYVVGGKAFYNQQEIFDLLNLLRVLDSHCDEVALAGVLRSPFFSLRDDTLFLLAQHPGGLAGGLLAPALNEELSAEERKRAEFAASTLEDLRRMKNRLPIAALLNEILQRTAYDAVLTAEFLGERKLANLRKLIEMAREFDSSQVASLTEFIEWLNDAVTQQPDEAPAAVHAEKSPVVRLMTIHQSKGLEFPVVFLPDLQRKEMNDRGIAAFDSRLGPLVRSPEENAPDGLTLFRWSERRHDVAESARLFYVAVTRAADMLVLSSGIDPDAREPQGWRAFLGERFDLETGAFRLQAAAGEVPQVRVTTTKPDAAGEPHGTSKRPDWTKLIEAARKEKSRGVDAAERLAAPLFPRAAARTRYSFSRLSGVLEVPLDTQADRILLPVEAEEQSTLDPAVLGTLVHGVLATIDFVRPDDVPRIVRRQLAQIVGDLHSREAAEYAKEATTVVRQFLETPRAKSLAAAKRLHRELEFVLSWPLDAPPSPDAPYLQGFVDCLYQNDAGRWCLIDYKTNRVIGGDAARAAEPYRMQLSIYALATERILGQAPDELAICFLRSGREHTLVWDDAARRAALAFISQSLANRPT